MEITGQALFPVTTGSAYRTQATEDQVALAATVSLIDPAADETVATALTDAHGVFRMNSTSALSAGEAYYLEAVKGLNDNAVGSDAARERTLIDFNGNWQSITQGPLIINQTTTALCIIASLNQGTVTPAKLINTVVLGAVRNGIPDTFIDTGTGISQSAFEQVYPLVTQALASDFDPFDAVVFNGTAFVTKSNLGLVIDRILPDPAAVGATVTIWGSGFGSGDTVTFAGGATATILSATANELQVQVPVGAQTGNVTVTVGTSGSASVPFTVLPDVSGGVSAS